ncbi:MAG: membrane protein insertion efficiency factor YidD [Endomicrobiales bacterium]|nr:membrane protein insertion efficiency factor YidD [Endomicrobiales bacterium]
MKDVLLFLINLYRLFSRAFPPRCRFHPSCSEYARGAVEKHGALRGTYLSAKRLLKCHPFNSGGYDPVP